jgi:hypothetical protein
MRRQWRQFKLDWEEGLRRLPFFTQRAVVALLGVLVATLALLGGLASLVQAPSPPREVEGTPGPGQSGAGGTTLAPPGAAQPGGADAPGPAGAGAATAPGAAGAGGVPGAAGPRAQGGVPVTTLPAAGAAATTSSSGGRTPGTTSTTSTTTPDHTLLPPITVTLSLPL